MFRRLKQLLCSHIDMKWQRIDGQFCFSEDWNEGTCPKCGKVVQHTLPHDYVKFKVLHDGTVVRQGSLTDEEVLTHVDKMNYEGNCLTCEGGDCMQCAFECKQ